MDKQLAAILDARAWTLGDVALVVDRAKNRTQAVTAIAAALMIDQDTAAQLEKVVHDERRRQRA